MKLWQKNILSMVLGALIGANYNLTYLKIFGDLFINVSKMIAVPLIFLMIIKSITALARDSGFKHLLTRSLAMFIGAASVASLIGIITSLLFLNQSINLSFGSFTQSNNVFEMLIHIVPKNIFAMFLEEKMIQIVLLAIFIAYALLKMETQSKAVYKLVDEISALFLKMLQLILKFTPFAVFSYSTWMAGSLNLETIARLAEFIQILFLAYLLQLILLSLYLKFYAKISPRYFFANSFEYQLFAFSTGNSKASLPFTIDEAIDKLKISSAKANLLIPLASSLNVVGLSIYLSVVAVFLAHFYQVDLQSSDYFMILVISVFTPIGAAGLAGGALLVIPILLTSLNLPPEGLVLMAAIDPIINGIRTAMNITIDVAISLTLDK
jgi:Na+/H+-dicarboxylate symporter